MSVDSSEFWCRAFLAEMTANRATPDHLTTYADLELAADAALEVAQRRGMVTGEGEAPEDRPAGCTCQLVMGLGNPSGPARRALVPTREPCPVHAPDRGRVLERVEFTAEYSYAGRWTLVTAAYPTGVVVVEGDHAVAFADGNAVRIKWGETAPPKPIEVWIERRG